MEWLQNAPVWWANAATEVMFILIALAVFAVPKRVFMADAPNQSHWRDVRLWAVILIAVQLGIYAVFS
jgi:hypothetical protein